MLLGNYLMIYGINEDRVMVMNMIFTSPDAGKGLRNKD